MSEQEQELELELDNIFDDVIFEILTWKTKTYFFHEIEIKGVEELNNFSDHEFCNYLYNYSNNTNIIKKNLDKNNLPVNLKHDINNGVLSKLQLNKYLSNEKNKLIDELREKLWKNNNKYLNNEDLKKLFNLI